MYMATSIGIDTSAVTSAKTSTSSTDSNSSLDKDAFLQLLVTQMQYQDPLEPTDNTEYMSQLAQFSTVEELQNINDTFTGNRALSLAGQYVILNVPDSAGNISQVSGLVDYVTISEGKTYFSINDQYYDSDYLDSVVSLDYLEYLTKNSTDTDTTEETSGDAAGSGDSTGSEESKTDGTEEA
jgi:flagellar basal-body rod modification protein FlgD